MHLLLREEAFTSDAYDSNSECQLDEEEESNEDRDPKWFYSTRTITY